MVMDQVIEEMPRLVPAAMVEVKKEVPDLVRVVAEESAKHGVQDLIRGAFHLGGESKNESSPEESG